MEIFILVILVLIVGFILFRPISKKEFDKIYLDLSKKFELELIPFLLKGVALNPKFNQDDGLHPNEKGVFIIAETIKKSITNFSKK